MAGDPDGEPTGDEDTRRLRLPEPSDSAPLPAVPSGDGDGPAVYGPPSYGPNGYGLQGYGPQGFGPPGFGSAGYGQPEMRASAADRDRTIDVLKAAYGEGRLTREEFESRAARTMAAKRYGELAVIVADLPAGPMGNAAPGYYPAPVTPTNGLAAGSVVCSLVGLLLVPLAVAGVVMGHVARDQIRRTGERGDGFAVAGLTFGYIAIVVWALAIALLVA